LTVTYHEFPVSLIPYLTVTYHEFPVSLIHYLTNLP
jgi:hypothetical protein